jgi:hypothetical protein
VWLRVSRNGQTVYSWGEKPEEGLGLAPHEKSPAAAIVPIPDLRAGDAIQVHAIWKSGQAKVRIRHVWPRLYEARAACLHWTTRNRQGCLVPPRRIH